MNIRSEAWEVNILIIHAKITSGITEINYSMIDPNIGKRDKLIKAKEKHIN